MILIKRRASYFMLKCDDEIAIQVSDFSKYVNVDSLKNRRNRDQNKTMLTTAVV